MGFLDLVFGKRDPTAGWPAPRGQPVIDRKGRKVGPITLGDPFGEARAVGKPERVTRQLSHQVFEYAGYDLEFGKEGLVCAKFDIEGAARVEVDGFGLTAATSPLDAIAWFGEPTSDSAEHGLRWLDYERDGATLALEFDGGKLRCVQYYGEGYA